MTDRPAPWKLSEIPTLWLDVETGLGVDDSGAPVRPILGGRRQKPNLVDLLDTAAHHHATRIMLSGKFPTVSATKTHWLLVATEGWRAAGHYIKDDRPPTGRFISTASNHRVEVRVAREWFGDDAIAPATAREAMRLLTLVLAKALPGHLAASPTATGQNIWAYALPKEFEPARMEPDLADLIHHTSGQHRTEHLVEGRSRCDCGDCVAADPGQDAGAGVRLRGWPVHVLRPVPRGRGRRPPPHPSPSRTRGPKTPTPGPGTWSGSPSPTGGKPSASSPSTGPTWRNGTTRTRPAPATKPGSTRSNCPPPAPGGGETRARLWRGSRSTAAGRWTRSPSRILKARENAAALDADPHLIGAVESALRSILLQTIGGFHSLGRDRTMVVESTFDVPPEHQGTIRTYGDVVTYLIPAELNARLQQFHHPEYSSQVWARERARILLGPTAPYIQHNVEWKQWGALEVDPAQLIGVNGDALYLTAVPQACLPTERGGGDDGKVGRLRVKGWIGEPMPAPPTTEARNVLRGRAEAYGLPADAGVTA